MALVNRSQASSKYGTLRGLIGRVRERGYGVDYHVRTYRAMHGLRDVHGKARVNLSPSSYEAYFGYIESFASEMLGQVPLKGFSNVAAAVEMPALPLDQEIKWNLARINASAGEINRIIAARVDIFGAIWRGKAEEALRLMDELSTEFGESIWLIESRIFLHQFSGGLKAQKQYVAYLKAALRTGTGVVPFLAHHISVRNEPSTSVARFISDIRRRCERIKDRNLGSYAEYRLTRCWPKDAVSIANILGVEQNHASIDVYETFLDLINSLRSGGLDVDLDPEYLVNSLDAIEDPRLKSLRPHPSVANFALGDFLSGNYSGVARRFAKEIEPNLDLLLISAISRANYEPLSKYSYREKKSLSNFLMSRLADCLRGGEIAEKAKALLEKSSLNIRDGGIVDVVSRLASADLLDTVAMRKAVIGFGGALGESPLLRSLSRHGSVITIVNELPALTGSEGITSIGSDAVRIAAACRAAKQDGLDEAMAQLESILRDHRSSLSHFGYLMGLELASRNRSPKVFLALLADAVVRFEYVPLSAGALAYASELRWKDVRPYAADLRTAVAAHYLHKKNIGKSWGSCLRFSIDEFLLRNKMEKPSDIDPVAHGAELVKHFWASVCEQNVVDMIRSINGVRALRLEMRKLYSELRSIDPGRSEYYDSMIVAITHALLIEDGKRIVDQSRIYVDETAMRDVLRVALAEPFSRYQALAPATEDDVKAFDEMLRLAVRGDSHQGGLAYPNNEADQLLVDMIKISCNKFLLDPSHGLDSYLSKRIRHGSIVGHLRGAIEQHDVIFNSQSNGATYRPSEDWAAKFSDLEEMDRHEVFSAISVLSQRVDAELLYAKNHVVQIQTPEKKDGLLGINLGASEYRTIRSFVRLDLTFEGFLTSMFASFWGLLNPSLDAVKKHLRERTALAISEEFSVARSIVNAKRVKYASLAELSSSLNQASRDVLAEIESVSQWFERSSVQRINQRYKLADAIAIGVESARAAYKGAKININRQSIQDFEITIGDIPILADVLLVTLGNVYTKSGVPNGAQVSIVANVDADSGVLSVRVENQVGEGVFLLHSGKVDAIREDISAGRIEQSLRREGESGLKKLAATVRQSARGSLIFGFSSEALFFVEVGLSLIMNEAEAV